MSLQILYSTVTQSPFTSNFSEFYSIQLRYPHPYIASPPLLFPEANFLCSLGISSVFHVLFDFTISDVMNTYNKSCEIYFVMSFPNSHRFFLPPLSAIKFSG